MSPCLLSSLCWFLPWLALRLWGWIWHIPPKFQFTFNGLHSIVSHKIELFLWFSLSEQVRCTKKTENERQLITSKTILEAMTRLLIWAKWMSLHLHSFDFCLYSRRDIMACWTPLLRWRTTTYNPILWLECVKICEVYGRMAIILWGRERLKWRRKCVVENRQCTQPCPITCVPVKE
jgi:hypothetical protein